MGAPLRLSKKSCSEILLKFERGGVYVALGFFRGQAKEKQFLRAGNRPENRIFRFPQSFSMKIRGFSWSVSKSFFDT